MIITYLGGEFVRVQFGNTVLAFNPPSKNSSIKTSRFGAQIALISLNHPDMNGIETVSHGDKKPFVISGPGEYEIKEVVIRGFPTKSNYGLKDSTERINTVYTVRLEGMKLCFLGTLSNIDIPPALKEELDEVDVLFVPVGGEGVLNPSQAEKLCVTLEPRLIIPIHFDGIGDKNSLKTFLKEAGEEKAPIADKLTIKKKDLEGKEGEVMVLKASS